MKESDLVLERQKLIALVTDVYVAGFCDGRQTSKLPFDTDMVLNSAFEIADGLADGLDTEIETDG